MVLGKVTAIWAEFAVMAVFNGLLREKILRRGLSERNAHCISTLILCAAVLFVSFAARDWLAMRSLAESWLISLIWMLATLAFEFLAGHYIFASPWKKILADYNVSKGRVWLLVPTTLLFAAPLSYKGLQSPWVVPYIMSNLVAAAMLVLAVNKPAITRWTIGGLFLYAGIYNNWLGLTNPLEYQGFAEHVIIPWYQDLILGPLREFGRVIISAIGIGQLLIAAGAFVGGPWLKPSMLGCCIFLVAIAPLGVGSACPFSFVVSLAAIIVAVGGPRPQ